MKHEYLKPKAEYLDFLIDEDIAEDHEFNSMTGEEGAEDW